MTTLLTTYPTATAFASADLDGTDWAQVGPLYESLLERTLKCKGCLEKLLLDRSELDATVGESRGTLYIEMTRHTDDEATKAAFLRFVEEMDPKIKDISFKLDRRIVQCPFADDLDEERYKVLLRGLDADVKLFREENIAIEVEETKLGQEYSEICGAMTVEFDGEEKTLPQMGPYMQQNDRQVRENAFRVVAERRLKDSEKIDTIFDSMVKLRNTIADNADLDDYRDWAFRAKHRFDYTPATCESFHRGVREHAVPLMHAMNRHRAEAMKLDTLRPWDLDVDPLGREPLRPFDGSTELIDGASRIFHRMDPSLGELFDTMREGDALDLESRKGKAPGGYQYDRERRRLPFIFMNAAGLMRDVDTMVHEAGHAFHSMLSRDEPLVAYRHPPIEFAEVASMSMELIAHPYLDEFLSEEDAGRARRKHLEGVVTTLCWVATIDAFQHWLYTHPHHTSEQRDIYWLELHANFGPDVSWDGLHSERAKLWHRQLHLFEVPFYYIEYGIAQLGALQMWMIYREDPQRAIDLYRKAMSLGGSRPLPELFAEAGLVFDFGPVTIARLLSEVEAELAALPA
ncbi:MAG: M3 family oligoendopeptidase [Planctomycetes bacterium]|jgi:oligoendopeptidase F|nr:M3 family oligoendopeptidase [Planctomycetota bacterium]MCP4838810.1 M3 family oligoendopeptidase [Planctomycetota bacterium]